VNESCCSFYSGCQKNVPISGRFFATTFYAAILFSERDYDKRYNPARSEIGQKPGGDPRMKITDVKVLVVDSPQTHLGGEV
jgi:hypothetical protein